MTERIGNFINRNWLAVWGTVGIYALSAMGLVVAGIIFLIRDWWVK